MASRCSKLAVLASLTLLAIRPSSLISEAAEELPTCFGVPATIVGTDGDDDLVGTDGADVIVGRDGNDRITPGLGDDRVCAGAGNDVIGGPPGDDLRFDGNDLLSGGDGSDRLGRSAQFFDQPQPL